ncbi:glycerophosphoryl diester phosphodiesterase [Bacillus sp. SORGH_AS 510]|uniref:glycerophosphodiester phosphodiesterase n=1 Tax=Bacillus sp. SORGH_AS_0510 TaxID=3041771 RepID=UPI002789C945|nr:glycerophosphodiester phosphodiesterase family protein [Bacillus sp. SORGH_AS_0510]MDQ1146952.1 glycerophosphoryl diester phosphodiesterase [Bacillus sp. SORGH_AS_0510]
MRSFATIIILIFMVAYRIGKKLSKGGKGQSLIKIGHRGAAAYCPENTYASFNKALELGVDYLELDIQMTRDGEIVVIHDPTVNRTTNAKGRVKDFTLKEIQKLDAGSWFHPTFSNERIPSFSDFLDTYAGKVGLLIELKKPSLYPGIEEKVANELLKRGLATGEEDQIIVQSFDQSAMKNFHHLLPKVPIGILVKKAALNGLSHKELSSYSNYATYVNPKLTMVNKKLIRKIHHYGFKTMIWTVNRNSDIRRLKHFSVDGMISDYPDLLSNKKDSSPY